eukprot:6199066-Pleurochrysis_carterae.AAC.2
MLVEKSFGKGGDRKIVQDRSQKEKSQAWQEGEGRVEETERRWPPRMVAGYLEDALEDAVVAERRRERPERAARHNSTAAFNGLSRQSRLPTREMKKDSYARICRAQRGPVENHPHKKEAKCHRMRPLKFALKAQPLRRLRLTSLHTRRSRCWSLCANPSTCEQETSNLKHKSQTISHANRQYGHLKHACISSTYSILS